MNGKKKPKRKKRRKKWDNGTVSSGSRTHKINMNSFHFNLRLASQCHNENSTPDDMNDMNDVYV